MENNKDNNNLNEDINLDLENNQIKKENDDINKENLSNYYESNIKKNKYYKELEKEANEYMKSSSYYEEKRINLNNIHKPLLKLLLVFIIAMSFVMLIKEKTNKYPELQGLWGDDKGNYYEIYNETFEMNSGNKDNPFYIGRITNVVKNDKNYIILIKGIKYNYNEDGTKSIDKEMDLILTIENFTQELKTIMKAKIGNIEYEIIKLENTLKHKRK